jgi:hypothetical protein
VAEVSKRAAEWAGLVGELLAILLGLAMVWWGWEDFGWGLAVIGAIGFVVSGVRLWRGRGQDESSTARL